MQTGYIDVLKDYVPNAYTHCGSVIFRNIFDKDKIAFCKSVGKFDDNLITLYCFSFGKVYYIDEPIYAYRQTDSSVWNSKNQYEQYLLNAMDYKILCHLAPKFKKSLARRHFHAIKQTFKNKKRLQELLGKEKFESYIKENKEENNDFILNLLSYNQLSLAKKIKTIMQYYFIKYLSRTKI